MKLRELGTKIKRAGKFVVEDVWDIEITSLTRMKAAGVKAVRVVFMVFRGFRKDECPLFASSLTFSTIMAIVPILAFSLAMARGLGGAETAKNKIRSGISEWTQRFGQESVVTNAPHTPAKPVAMVPTEAGDTEPKSGDADEVDPQLLAAQINDLVEQAFEKVENISFAGLGAVGLTVLLWMIISVLGRVENAFNRVWGVAVNRTLWRKFTDYLSVLLILPLLAIAASSMKAADISRQFLSESAASGVSVYLESAMLKQGTIVLMTTLCFAFIIMFMPNTKVKTRAGLAGGFVTALLFIGWLTICAAMQVGAARMGKIYGSFAIVPILLMWVNISWQIILFGAEVSFAVQNCATYRMESGADSASTRSRILLALSITAEVCRAMEEAKAGGFDVADYAAAKKIPVRLLNSVVDELLQAGLLGELAGRTGNFVLVRSPSRLRVQDVIDAVLGTGVEPAKLGLEAIDPRIDEILRKAEDGIGRSLSQATVEDLLKDVA